MYMVERGGIPEWARKERRRDLEWIRENLYVFKPTAEKAYKELGRGVIVVDTTSRPTGEGNPFAYFPKEIIEEGEDEDTKRMVNEYNPESEFVIMLLKSEERTSTYRVQALVPKNRSN
jgi:hypothetical protein